MGRFRHELKYIMTAEDCDKLFEEISPYCDHDPHVGPFRTYEIASVYYDTDDLRFYYDREESVGYRRKIRLRSYNREDQSQALFIEIKEKHQQYVCKKRINLKNDSVLYYGVPHHLLPLELVLEELEDGAEARELKYLQQRLRLYPIVNIRYHRRPLIPKYEHDMRITFDTRITAGGNSLPQYDEETEKPIIGMGKGVFEVKTNETIPMWLQSAMSRYQMTQTRYSKYCLGVDMIFGRGGKGFYPKVEWPAGMAPESLQSGSPNVHQEQQLPEFKKAAGA